MTNNYCDYEYEILSTHKENNAISDTNIKWRVKLYHLNDEGQWDDKGTGYVFINKQVKLLI
jgi:hypothetical protein